MLRDKAARSGRAQPAGASVGGNPQAAAALGAALGGGRKAMEHNTISQFLRLTLREALGTASVFMTEAEARKAVQGWADSVRGDWDVAIRERKLPDGIVVFEGRASGPFSRYGEPYRGEASTTKKWAALPPIHPLRPIARALKDIERAEEKLRALSDEERRRWRRRIEETLRRGGTEAVAEALWAFGFLRRM